MKTFREMAIEEALKIISKKSNKPTPKEEKLDISYFDNVNIKRTKHVGQVRDGQANSRDDGLKDSVILKAIKKAWKKGLEPGKTMITFKNKSKKYDMIVIDWDKNKNSIFIVTAIQDSKLHARDYKTPKHKDSKLIMTEETIMNFIELEDI